MEFLHFYQKYFKQSLVIVLSIVTFLCLNFRLSYLPIEGKTMDEICDNALDDDGDGLIDINDSDCICEEIKPISLIPNPSFENLDCCPDTPSQLICAEAWRQASGPTTDLIHICSWLGWDEFPPPLPFPDGEGIMGFRDGRVREDNNTAEQNWKEYAGACLISPMEIDSSYRFEFDVGFVDTLISPPINITFFGTSSCENLPFGFGNQNLGCPTNGANWVNLGSTFVDGGLGNSWMKGIIEVTPEQEINAIAIGPDCPGVESTVSTYYFFDNLILSDIRSFELKISTIGHPCSEAYALKIEQDASFTYQWYKNGIALVGENLSQLKKNYGDGDYQVRIEDGLFCRISTNFIHRAPTFSDTVFQTICEEDVFSFGNQQLNEAGLYIDTFRTEDNCKNVVTLDLKVLRTLADTVSAKIFEGENYKIDNYSFNRAGEHLLTLISSQNCDSLVLLNLAYYNLYFPNVFSPNFDGINDSFTILSEVGLIKEVELIIFDRWGGQIYKGKEWDGQHQGKMVNSGIFFYLANITMSDGITRQFFNEITLLR